MWVSECRTSSDISCLNSVAVLPTSPPVQSHDAFRIVFTYTIQNLSVLTSSQPLLRTKSGFRHLVLFRKRWSGKEQASDYPRFERCPTSSGRNITHGPRISHRLATQIGAIAASECPQSHAVPSDVHWDASKSVKCSFLSILPIETDFVGLLGAHSV